MQSNISACKALDHWKASVIACSFVNKLVPRTETTEQHCEDKEQSSDSVADSGRIFELIKEKERTKPTRMGRMKNTPMRIGPGLVGANHPSRIAAAESLPKGNSEYDKSGFSWAHEAPSYRSSVLKNAQDAPENNNLSTNGYPQQTSTPKSLLMKDPSRPTSEHSSSSMSEQSFRSDVEDGKLVISTEKSESSWIANQVKPLVRRMSSNGAASQKQTQWISPRLFSSPINASDEERDISMSKDQHVSQRSFSFSHCQMNSMESMDTDQVKEESESNIEKTVRPTKLMRCKQCDTEHVGKENLWQHLRDVHPKENHLLCDYCPFATRYRHHYEYHIRNHRGEKPFKCETCGYRCVNKSMLASHMKSHTTVYEYKCDTCSYETKYFHSLKQHLEKTNHFASPDKTGVPKNINDPLYDRGSDLSPNGSTLLPLPNGPSMLNGVSLLPPPPPLHNPFSKNFPDKIVSTSGLDHSNIPPPIFLNSPVSKSNNFPLMNHPASAIVNSLVPNPAMALQLQNTMSLLYSEGRKLAGMDPAQAILHDALLASHLPDVANDLSTTQHSKRKRVKSEAIDEPKSSIKRESPNNFNDNKNIDASKPKSPGLEKAASPSSDFDGDLTISDLSYCKYCKVFFVDPVAYQVHAGNHNFDDPFKCNRCGHRANDAISFMSHGLCSKQ